MPAKRAKLTPFNELSLSSAERTYLTTLINHVTSSIQELAYMSTRKPKLEQAHGCKLIRLYIHQEKYRLRISSKIYDDNKTRYLSTGIDAVDGGLRLAHMLQLEMQRDIDIGMFDETLNKYKPKVKKYSHIKRPDLTLGKLWADYCEYKRPLISPSTYESKYNLAYRKAIEIVGMNLPVNPATASLVRDYLLQNRAREFTVNLLSELRKACDRAINDGLLSTQNNPFFGMSVDASKSKTAVSDKVDDGVTAYSRDEVKVICEYFEKHYPEYYQFTVFRFSTGTRFGESIELRMKDVSSDCKTIFISRAYAFLSGSIQTTKTGKARKFNCSDKLSTLLKSLKSDDKEQLLFTNRLGYRILESDYRNHWNKVTRALVKSGEISKSLSLKHTRHTAVTLARESLPASAVAIQFGHSEAVATAHYNDSSKDRSIVMDFV